MRHPGWTAGCPTRRRALGVGLVCTLAVASARAGVVVLRTSGEAQTVGIAAGDELSAWRAAADARADWHPISRWSDPWFLDFVEIPKRGAIEIDLAHSGERRKVVTFARPLEIEVAPQLPAETAAAVAARLAPDAPLGAGSIGELRGLLVNSGADAVAWGLARLATTAAARPDLETANAAWLAAAEAAPAPFSGELLRRAGEVQIRLGRLDEADATYARALEIWRADDPNGIGVSVLLNAIGNLRGRQHRLAEAQGLIAEACALRRRPAPRSWLVANCLNSLGIVAGRRNDLAEAEQSFVEALAIDRELGRDSGPMLSNLGVVARLRGDLERAERYVEEGIALFEQRGEVQLAVAKQINLANIAADRGDLARAGAILDQVIDPGLVVAPDRETEVSAHLDRAVVRQRLGDLDAADADLDRAEELLGVSATSTTDGANLAEFRAQVAFDRGDFARAAAACGASLNLQMRLRPDTQFEAAAASLGARVAARRGDWPAADRLFERSIRAVERQQQRVGGGERGLVAFREKLRPLYRFYVDYLVARGRTAAALELLERYRAQALRALMTQRDLQLEAQAPPALAAERARLGTEIEAAYSRLAKLGADAVERVPLREQIDLLHRRREELGAQIRAVSPTLARAEAPAAYSVAELAAALPEGTLALVYDLGEDSGRLFALDHSGRVEVFEIAASTQQLGSEVARWLDEVTRPRAGAALPRIAEELGETLLAPVSRRLAAAQRLLIVPDGPLHALSFAALSPPKAIADRGRYLIESLAVSRDVSLSVFAATSGPRRSTASDPRPAAIFGDPTTSTEAVSRFRAELGALPATRDEASAISALFGSRARLFLGAAASESAARAVLPGAGTAHFACHAVVDEQLPLDSALVLSPDDTSGGLLQAWEIAEQIHLDGALVVLSACETARGNERAGEGIVGLVRSLQVAGAETVVASLWRIADESTAELMKRFYRHLADGDARDEALRRAQLELLASPIDVVRDGRMVRLDASAPRHWAPFVLVGRSR